MVRGIKDDTVRLLKITGELLNITQVESGSIQINLLPSEVNPIVGYAVNANKSAADHKNININGDTDNSVSIMYGDSKKTAWVLTNLNF